jgi:hypothetical protein
MEMLIEAADGLFLEWRPDWPASLPPDLFYPAPGSGVISISVTFEPPKKSFGDTPSAAGTLTAGTTDDNAAPETVPDPVTVELQNGAFVQFPVFQGAGFVQGQAEYSGRKLWKIRNLPASGDAGEDADNSVEAEILEYNDDGKPATIRVRTGADYWFVAMAYRPGRIEETWYDAGGNPLEFITADSSGEAMKISYAPQPAAEGDSGQPAAPAPAAEIRGIFFDSFKKISGIETADGSYFARYNRNGRPQYLAVTSGPPEKAVPSVNYRFQWDEAGRLTRLRGQTGAGELDYRYEYSLDGQGNWIERREIRMQRVSAGDGRLFPVPGVTVRRKILYGEGD